ncbi:MAG: amidohydrolase family protein, partial [Adlercreutzia equolifaciens]
GKLLLNTEGSTMPVIDAHSHIYPDKIACKASSAVGDFYGVDMNAKNASASSMLAACEGSPITHHLVHSVATTPGQVPIINDFIAEQCRAHDNFVGFATMHQDFEDVEGEINRAIDLGLKGVKIHPTPKGEHGRPAAHAPVRDYRAGCPSSSPGDYRYDSHIRAA